MSALLEVKLAQMEGKLDSYFARLEERMDGMEKRLAERFHNHEGRIVLLEKSSKRQGERIGRLEADANQVRGGWWTVTKLLALGAALGGIVVKYFGR